MKSKTKRVLANESSDQQGFQQSQLKVFQTPAKLFTAPTIQPIRVHDTPQTICQKFTSPPFSIYNNINLFPYPSFLDSPLEDTLVKMEKNKNKDNQGNSQVQAKDLGEFLRTSNLKCIYNKFDSRVDYKLDMTSFYKSFEYHLESGKKDHWKQFMGKDGPNTEDIEFCSNFESGNLQFVFSGQNVYYLLLQNDTNTHGYNQWFYFRIRNKRKCKVKLIILNMAKPVELIRYPMGISVLSLQQKSFCRKFWTEGGNNVKFYRNGLKRKTKSKANTQYYSLEFDYEFKFQSDSVYFAMNIPFTYTKLVNSIDRITSTKRENIVLNVKILGTTVSNNKIYSIQYIKRFKAIPMDVLKGSASTADDESRLSNQESGLNISKNMASRKKKSIVFLGRQHPCETNSSYILQGITNFLADESEVSLFLLDTYDIYIIPMTNPDGVIHGLSRTNLCGYDINREWADKNKEKSNEVAVISSYLEYLNQTTDIKYVFDFHSHSKKLGTFGHFSDDTLELRSLAWFLEETNPHFVYSSCIFDKARSRQPNFRNYAFSLGIRNSITIETSYFGKLEHGLYRRYNTKQLHEIGIALIKALSEFSEEDVSKVIVNNFVKSNIKENVVENIPSESEPEGDYLQERERVKIILSGRREKESSMPKGFSRNTSPTKPKLIKRESNTFTKTMGNLRMDDPAKTIENKHPHLSTHTSSVYALGDKPFKPYSKEQILRDDSMTQECPSPKRRMQTEKTSKSPSRLYFWDESKFNVSKPVSYPTSLYPYLQRLASSDTRSFDNSPIKRRVSQVIHKHSLTTQIQLQKVIMQSSGVRQQRQDLTIFQKRKKSRAHRNLARKLFPTTMKVSSSSSFHY